MSFDSTNKSLIDLKMRSKESLAIKADWLARFVIKQYPNDEAKRLELAKFGAQLAAKHDSLITL